MTFHEKIVSLNNFCDRLWLSYGFLTLLVLRRVPADFLQDMLWNNKLSYNLANTNIIPEIFNSEKSAECD